MSTSQSAPVTLLVSTPVWVILVPTTFQSISDPHLVKLPGSNLNA